MGFNKFQEDVNVHQKLGDFPNVDNGITAEQLKEMFDRPANQVKDGLNKLIEDINATTGASNIGANPIYDGDSSGATVQSKLENLKYMLDKTTLGQIPDDSISTQKLLNNCVTNEKIVNGSIDEFKLSQEVKELINRAQPKVGDLKTTTNIKENLEDYLLCDGSIISLEDYPLLKNKVLDLKENKLGYIDHNGVTGSVALKTSEMCYSSKTKCYALSTTQVDWIYTKLESDTMFIARYTGSKYDPGSGSVMLEKDGVFYFISTGSEYIYIITSNDGINFNEVVSIKAKLTTGANKATIIDNILYLSIYYYNGTSSNRGYLYCNLSDIATASNFRQFYSQDCATSIRKLNNKLYACFGTTTIATDNTTLITVPYATYDIYYLNGLYYVKTDTEIYSTTDLEDVSKYIKISENCTISAKIYFKYIPTIEALMTTNGYILENGVFKLTKLVNTDAFTDLIVYDGKYLYGNGYISVDGKNVCKLTSGKIYKQGYGDNFVYANGYGDDINYSDTIYVPSENEVYLPNINNDTTKTYIKYK